MEKQKSRSRVNKWPVLEDNNKPRRRKKKKEKKTSEQEMNLPHSSWLECTPTRKAAIIL